MTFDKNVLFSNGRQEISYLINVLSTELQNVDFVEEGLRKYYDPLNKTEVGDLMDDLSYFYCIHNKQKRHTDSLFSTQLHYFK